jgi:hypothetical protein
MKENFNDSNFSVDDNRTKHFQNTKSIMMRAICYIFYDLVWLQLQNALVAFTPMPAFQFAVQTLFTSISPFRTTSISNQKKQTIKELQVLLQRNSEAVHSRLSNLRETPLARCTSVHMH